MEESKAPVSRRSLLRRAGTVAAGAGVIGVAAASPASAADVPVNLDVVNNGTGTTTINGGTASKSTLALTNTAGAAPLLLQPSTSVNPASNPPGTTFTDAFGDLHIVGHNPDVPASANYDNMLYSPTWGMMPFPIFPFRFVSTYVGDIDFGREFIVAGSANYDSLGRVLPKNSAGPDLIVDFSAIIAGGFAAVQGNLTIGEGQGAGFASLWDEGDWPGHSNLNFPSGTFTENFTQTIIGEDMRMRLKVSRPGIFVFDIFGLLLVNWLEQLVDTESGAKATKNKAVRSMRQRISTMRRRATNR